MSTINSSPPIMEIKTKIRITKAGKDKMLLVAINNERANHGLKPLDTLPERKDVATARLAELIALMCRVIEQEFE